ncbi:LuxR C-terminal-related transcriptional regulator [Nonomuraea fuscirosea]
MVPRKPGEPHGLSPREAEVLAGVAEQLSNARIARRLQVSVRTVESHVSSLLRKYGVADRTALAAMNRHLSSPSVEPGRITQIPVSHTSFVGRRQERQDTLAALAHAAPVCLVGPGGVGKTRLGAVVAQAASREFSAGGAFVDLAPIGEGFVLRAVADALGLAERPPQPLAEVVAERLALGRSLLVLDNCEHPDLPPRHLRPPDRSSGGNRHRDRVLRGGSTPRRARAGQRRRQRQRRRSEGRNRTAGQAPPGRRAGQTRQPQLDPHASEAPRGPSRAGLPHVQDHTPHPLHQPPPEVPRFRFV